MSGTPNAGPASNGALWATFDLPSRLGPAVAVLALLGCLGPGDRDLGDYEDIRIYAEWESGYRESTYRDSVIRVETEKVAVCDELVPRPCEAGEEADYSAEVRTVWFGDEVIASERGSLFLEDDTILTEVRLVAAKDERRRGLLFVFGVWGAHGGRVSVTDLDSAETIYEESAGWPFSLEVIDGVVPVLISAIDNWRSVPRSKSESHISTWQLRLETRVEFWDR